MNQRKARTRTSSTLGRVSVALVLTFAFAIMAMRPVMKAVSQTRGERGASHELMPRETFQSIQTFVQEFDSRVGDSSISTILRLDAESADDRVTARFLDSSLRAIDADYDSKLKAALASPADHQDFLKSFAASLDKAAHASASAATAEAAQQTYAMAKEVRSRALSGARLEARARALLGYSLYGIDADGYTRVAQRMADFASAEAKAADVAANFIDNASKDAYLAGVDGSVTAVDASAGASSEHMSAVEAGMVASIRHAHEGFPIDSAMVAHSKAIQQALAQATSRGVVFQIASASSMRDSAASQSVTTLKNESEAVPVRTNSLGSDKNGETYDAFERARRNEHRFASWLVRLSLAQSVGFFISPAFASTGASAGLSIVDIALPIGALVGLVLIGLLIRSLIRTNRFTKMSVVELRAAMLEGNESDKVRAAQEVLTRGADAIKDAARELQQVAKFTGDSDLRREIARKAPPASVTATATARPTTPAAPAAPRTSASSPFLPSRSPVDIGSSRGVVPSVAPRVIHESRSNRRLPSADDIRKMRDGARLIALVDQAHGDRLEAAVDALLRLGDRASLEQLSDRVERQMMDQYAHGDEAFTELLDIIREQAKQIAAGKRVSATVSSSLNIVLSRQVSSPTSAKLATAARASTSRTEISKVSGSRDSDDILTAYLWTNFTGIPYPSMWGLIFYEQQAIAHDRSLMEQHQWIQDQMDRGAFSGHDYWTPSTSSSGGGWVSDYRPSDRDVTDASGFGTGRGMSVGDDSGSSVSTGDRNIGIAEQRDPGTGTAWSGSDDRRRSDDTGFGGGRGMTLDDTPPTRASASEPDRGSGFGAGRGMSLGDDSGSRRGPAESR